MSFPPVEDQLAIIRRGIEKIVPEEELAAKLKHSRETNTPLRVKYGIDPTAADVHLGHTVPLRKMRQFQEMGHQAVIIIGNYTAMVGDPSGRDEVRQKKFTEAEVEQNAQDYLDQVGKVVDLSTAEVHRNGDWFGAMTFADILNLCGKVTVAQLLTRDDFANRMKNETAIYLHECLYPIMQAWDSVKIQADIELGGTEQLYSFMLARTLQKDQSLPQQIGVMSPILVGIDGVKRMGKSLGNYIGISEPPFEMMKKFMQIPDDVMPMYFELLTDLPIEETQKALAENPKSAKKLVARTVITQYHNEADAIDADERWEREISGKGLPADIPTAPLSRSELTDGKIPLAVAFKLLGLCKSTSDAGRLIKQGGAAHGEDKTKFDPQTKEVEITDGLLLWAGKKRFCRVQLVD